MTSTTLSAGSDNSNKRRHASHHEDAGGHHGGGVDQAEIGSGLPSRPAYSQTYAGNCAIAHRADEQQDAAGSSRPIDARNHLHGRRSAISGAAANARVVDAVESHQTAAIPKHETQNRRLD